jgi:hypothetical protein
MCSDVRRRFLRARRFDPAKAQKQFADAEAWRKKHGVDALYAGFDPQEMEDSRRFYPRWTGRRSKVRLHLLHNTLFSIRPLLEWPTAIRVQVSIPGRSAY